MNGLRTQDSMLQFRSRSALTCEWRCKLDVAGNAKATRAKSVSFCIYCDSSFRKLFCELTDWKAAVWLQVAHKSLAERLSRFRAKRGSGSFQSGLGKHVHFLRDRGDHGGRYMFDVEWITIASSALVPSLSCSPSRRSVSLLLLLPAPENRRNAVYTGRRNHYGGEWKL